MYDFLFVITEFFSLALTVEALQGKMCQDSLLSGGGRSLGAKISGGRGRPGEHFLVSTKLDTFCYSDGANCTVLCAAVLTQYRPVTDGQTDGQRDGQTDGRNCRSQYSACNAARCKMLKIAKFHWNLIKKNLRILWKTVSPT